MIAKILGAVYRIPLTNLLGAEGIGIYQLVFPIYALMLTLSSSGIPTAIARLVSEKRTLGEKLEEQKVMKSSFVLLFVLGTLATLIMLLIAVPLSNLQGLMPIFDGFLPYLQLDSIIPADLLSNCLQL